MANPNHFTLVFASAVSLITYSLAFGLMKKSRNAATRYFLLFFTFFNIALLFSTLTTFFQPILSGKANAGLAAFFAGRLIFLGCVSFGILFIHTLINMKLAPVFFAIVGSTAIAIVAHGVHLHRIGLPQAARFFDVSDIFLNGAILYAIFVYILFRKNIKDRIVAATIKPFIILSLLFLPLIVLDDFIGVSNRSINFLFYPVYNVAINITLLYTGYRHYLSERQSDGKSALSDAFIRRYNITPREREVMVLLLKGYRNKKIAELLFISPATVKNHVHRIFSKTECSNRVALSARCAQVSIEPPAVPQARYGP